MYLDVGTSLVHPFALGRSGLLSSSLDPTLSGGAVWYTLCFMWLKFLILWRFARAWCLMDGVDVTENMPRVWNDNYSISGFWKGWHSSFNKWLIRYIYVPLGGSSNRALAVWPVFIFVAVWHDVEAKLLAWGLLNALFFVLEHWGKALWRSTSVSEGANAPIVESLAGASYIFVLMAVNSIGYSVGLSGVGELLDRMMTREALYFMAGSVWAFFCGVRLMFEVRNIERTWEGVGRGEAAKMT